MKKNKLLYGIVILVGVICLTLTSCSEGHEHTFSTEWTKNETEHWHASTCGHNVKDSKEKHTYGEWEVVKESTIEEKGLQERYCLVCGYEEEKEMDLLPHEHTFSPEWTNDEIKHWHASTCDCDVKGSEEEHTYSKWELVNPEQQKRTCSICGYEDYLTNGLKYTLSNDDTYYIVSGTMNVTDLLISSYYNDLPVKEIAPSAFFDCYNLTSIVIPDTVTTIGDRAFSTCLSLKNIEIPNSVTEIGEWAFYKCSSLTSIVIPDSVTSIGKDAFCDCSNLTSVEIPNSVTNIGSRAFFECSSLISIAIPDSVTIIEETTFQGCSSLTNVVIPNSITKIRQWAFRYCSSLTSIEIPNSVTSIEQATFDGCSSLTSIEIPSSVTSIGYDAFGNCSSLMSIVVDENNPIYDSRNNCNAIIETAYNTLIRGCNITVIPNTIRRIDDFAFEGCISLASIEIPSSVTSIGVNTFNGCSGLTSIVVDENNPIYDSRNNCNAIIETETNVLIQGCKNTIIPNNVTSIGGCAFNGCSSLTSIEIPNGVTSIGGFEDCINLKKIKIPNSVASIGGSAFAGCSSLTSIELPSSVTSIGKSAFARCSSLKSIEIPNGVTNISASTFYECKSLTNIVIPNGVTFIGDFAFAGCSSLRSIVIPDTVTKIDIAALKNCNGLTVFYTGSVTNWNSMNNSSSDIRGYMVAYYSEAKPTDTNYKYWHYIKGTPTLWS